MKKNESAINSVIVELCSKLNVSEDTIYLYLTDRQKEELNKEKQKKETDKLSFGKCSHCGFTAELKKQQCNICFTTPLGDDPSKAYHVNVLQEISQTLRELVNLVRLHHS